MHEVATQSVLTLNHVQTAVLAVIMVAWLAGAVWAVLTGWRLRARAAFHTSQADRLSLLLESAPALPIVVRPDGRIEAPQRICDWLGLRRVPNFLSDLSGDGAGLTRADADALTSDVTAAQRSGRSFSRTVRVEGSARTLLLRGAQAAPGLATAGAVIVWIFDATETQAAIGDLTAQVATLNRDLDAMAALVEAAPIPMWYRNVDLELMLINSAYARAVDAADAQDVVTRRLELVEPIDGQTAVDQARRARSEGKVKGRDVPATVGGQRRMLHVVDVPMADGTVAGYALDIDAREQAEANLRRFIATQRDTLDQLSAGVAQFAVDRTLVFCNAPFRRMFDIKPDWVEARQEFDRVLDKMRENRRVPETRDFVGWKRERRDWFAATERPAEETWLLADGMHVRVVAQPLPDGGLLVIFEDRTEHAQLARARDTLLRVRSASFDNLFEAIGVFESDGRLHLWNHRFQSIWGFDEAFLAAHPRVDKLAEAAAHLLTNPSRAAAIREIVRSATQERKQRSGRLALKDGRHFEFAAVPLPDGNALFTMLDISDSRRIERVLRDRAEALEAADRVKTAFVANMSYELRTPLTSIVGFAEMLDNGFAGPLSPTGTEYVHAILGSAARLGTLVDQVLDLTQDNVTPPTMAHLPIEIAALLRGIGADVGQQAEKAGLDFALDLHDSAGRVDGDSKRLGQALQLLLDNAVRYTPRGGRVLLHASGNAKRALIVVSDNGPGMDAAAQQRALDRFSRAIEPRTGEGQLGLGLPLARQFVEAHGGTLTLASEPGAGTAVSIELPR